MSLVSVAEKAEVFFIQESPIRNKKFLRYVHGALQMVPPQPNLEQRLLMHIFVTMISAR